ncbi:hypothetical protein [Pseudoduganella namucuonensis]|nr:hypothetical protein [Pseudoduganella namucuonensis]
MQMSGNPDTISMNFIQVLELIKFLQSPGIRTVPERWTDGEKRGILAP